MPELPEIGDIVMYAPTGWALDGAGSMGSVREAVVEEINDDDTLNLRVLMWGSQSGEQDVFVANVPESYQPENNPPGHWFHREDA